MNLIQKLVGTAGALALATASGTAVAGSYTFHQEGFGTFGVLSGSFTGEDNVTVDGILDRSELTAFDLSFAGDTNVPDFSFGLADLDGFAFVIGGGFLGDDLTEGLIDVAGRVLSGPQVLGSSGTYIDDGVAASNSKEYIVVQPANVPAVPEPSTYALMALGLAALGVATRRRR